jgi:hypothetical protein
VLAVGRSKRLAFPAEQCLRAAARQSCGGLDVIIAGSVSDDEARKTYPEGWKSPRPYIRIVPQPR